SKNKELSQFIEKILDGTYAHDYLMHEYGNESWSPLYSDAVINDMNGIKLDYSGSTSILNNYTDTALPQKVKDYLENNEILLDRQTLLDYSLNETFRQDLYIRGLVTLPVRQFLRQYGSQCFMLTRPLEDCKLDIKIPSGEMSLNPQVYDALLRLFEGEPKALKDAVKFGRQLSLSIEEVMQCLGILCGLGYLHPTSLHGADYDHFNRVNQNIADFAIQGDKALQHLVSPVTREATRANYQDLLFYSCKITDDAQALEEAAYERLVRDEVEVTDKAGQVVPLDMVRQGLKPNAEQYVEKVVPYYQSLGIINNQL
ncbi:MAG: methyltransferase regulatory domain-containing protein, partial [Pseudomonadota bacterium]